MNISKTTFKEVKKLFFAHKNGQNDPLRGPHFDVNLDFEGHISTFQAENTT